MNKPPEPAPKLNPLRTANNIIAAIPKEWLKAEMMFCDNMNMIRPIKRVSLQKNASGRQIILIHEGDFR